jgi:hypothetical protein
LHFQTRQRKASNLNKGTYMLFPRRTCVEMQPNDISGRLIEKAFSHSDLSLILYVLCGILELRIVSSETVDIPTNNYSHGQIQILQHVKCMAWSGGLIN